MLNPIKGLGLGLEVTNIIYVKHIVELCHGREMLIYLWV